MWLYYHNQTKLLECTISLCGHCVGLWSCHHGTVIMPSWACGHAIMGLWSCHHGTVIMPSWDCMWSHLYGMVIHDWIITGLCGVLTWLFFFSSIQSPSERCAAMVLVTPTTVITDWTQSWAARRMSSEHKETSTSLDLDSSSWCK